MKRVVLIDSAISTDATKVGFRLSEKDFRAGKPALKSRGLGSGDSVKIYERVNGGTQDTGLALDDTTTSRAIESVGDYAVDVTMVTGGPASVVLETGDERI